MRKKVFWCLVVSLISVVLTVSIFSTPASASIEDYFSYDDIDGEARITSVETTISGDITIPSTLDGLPVTSIGEWAFFCCENLTSITIPSVVTNIENGAFYCCYNLTSITIPNSVTSIGDEAFAYCESLTSAVIPNDVTSIGTNAFYACASLESIQIGTGVTSIGDNAFYNCGSLTSITIPNSVTSIGDNAFYACTNLTSITLSNTLTSIGNDAFYNCKSFTSITIPASVTSIGNHAFYGCESLTSIKVDESNLYYTDIDGVLFNKAKTELICYPSGNSEECIIPPGVTSIRDNAFAWCSDLTSIKIPSSVTSIGYSAFYGCESLTSIKVDENNLDYSDIDGVLFNKDKTEIICYPNKNGKEYIIPPSVTSIEDYAFSWCMDLTSIEIPSSVTSIGNYAFESCYGLSYITIPNSVTSIGNGAFYCCNALWSIEIPSSVTSIGDETFAYCDALESITLPSSITSIGNYAFQCCSLLGNIEIPSSVTSIGEWAFDCCNSMTSIIIPNSVTSIGEGAFNCCNDLATVYYNGTEEQWNEIEIGSQNEPLFEAELVFVSKSELESALEGTDLTVGKLADESEVVIVPTTGNVAVTEAELAEMLGNEEITIVSNNGMIGTGSKIIIGEQEVSLVVKGDIDGDGITTVFDALMVKKALANNGFENEALREFAADVDGATGTTEADVSALLAKIVGKN